MDEGRFFNREKFHLNNTEGKTELGNYHFAAPNEITDSVNDLIS